MGNYLNRALAAYFRIQEEGLMQPSQSLSGIVALNGLEYVVLRNTSEILAIYRITNQKQLKRLKRWPKELEIC